MVRYKQTSRETQAFGSRLKDLERATVGDGYHVATSTTSIDSSGSRCGIQAIPKERVRYTASASQRVDRSRGKFIRTQEHDVWKMMRQ